MRITPALLLCQLAPVMLIHSADLVVDVNQQRKSASSRPRDFIAVGSTLFFSAEDAVHGRELWKSDGTAAGTTLVKDIRPGSASSIATSDSRDRNRAEMGGMLYFPADDGEHGGVLYKTNGTAQGTSVVQDVPLQLAGGAPYELTAVGNTLFFIAGNALHGRELWKTDGSGAGTGMVKDLEPGPLSANLEQLTAVGSKLFFRTTSGAPRKVWKSDGTPQGTVPLAASQSSIASIYPLHLAAMGGILYFVREDFYGPEIWRTDGTDAGTRVVKPALGSFYLPGSLFAAGSRMYFPGLLRNPAGGDYGFELWQSDGTSAGTGQVRDINPGLQSSVSSFLVSSGNTFYFFADDGVHGTELWKTGGTAATTSLVKDLTPGAASSAATNNAAILNGLLYFFCYRDGGKYALWRSDGTGAGTSIVMELPGVTTIPAPFQLTAAGGKLFFCGNDGVNGEELWVSDGTSAGTFPVDINHATGDSSPGNLLQTGGHLVFTANETTVSAELWKSGGEDAVTRQLHLIPKASTSPVTLQVVADDDGKVYYNSGHESAPTLWRIDSTAGNVSALTPSASGFYQPGNLTIGGNFLFFTAIGGSAVGQELFSSDGTLPGTRLLKDIHPGVAWSNTTQLTMVGETLYFVARPTNSGFSQWQTADLWKSDGSPAGTVKVKTLGGPELNPGNFTPANGLLYFTRGATNFVKELWKSDGTEAGTRLITTTHPANAKVEISNLTGWQGKVFFTAYNPTTSTGELWHTDGTANGTLLLKSIPDCAGPGALHSLTPADGQLFFGHEGRSGYGLSGYTVWKTDGTSGGTLGVRRFDTVDPQAGSRKFAAAGGVVYFSGYDGVHGRELWRSDGSAGGTFLVSDLTGDSGSSNPDNFRIVGNKLYFAATTGDVGRELWSLPVAPPGLLVTGNANLVRNGSQLPLSSDFTVFGEVPPAVNSLTRSFRLSNTGGMALTIGGVVLSGEAASDFSVVSPPATSLPAGATANLSIRFTPSSPGIRKAAVEIKYGPAGAASYTFAISAGTPAGGIRGPWRQQYFGSPENQGNAADGADPDLDGISNYLEWAFHLNPAEGGSVPVATGLQGASFVYFCEISIAALNAGTLLSLEWTDTLEEGPWNNTGVSQEIISEDALVRKFRFLGPLGGGRHRYFRLKVTTP